MATKWVTVKGIVKWAKVYEPDAFMGAENWKLDFAPSNAQERKKWDDTGIQLKFRKEDDGLEYTRLRRPVKKVFSDEVTFFAPPEITGAVSVQYQDENGERIRQYKKGDKVNRVGEPIEIGNGSEVLVNVCYYDTVKGKGHRLESINVLNLVEFVRGVSEKTGEQEELKVEAEKQAEENFPTKKEKKVKEENKDSVAKDLNDDIPW
jgi:hypothetical protein